MLIFILATAVVVFPCSARELVQSGWLDWDDMSSVGGLGSETNEWYWYISQSQNAHVGRDGTIRGACARLYNADGKIDFVGFAVFRPTGEPNEYTVVGKSEEIIPTTTSGIHSFILIQPITGVRSDDVFVVGTKQNTEGYILSYIKSTGSFPIADTTTKLRWYSSGSSDYNDLEAKDVIVANGGGSAFGIVSMCPLMNPPKVIVVGDSISVGAQLNYSYRFNSTAKNRNGAFALMAYRKLGWDVELAGNMSGSNNAAEVLLFDLTKDPNILAEANNGLGVWDKNPQNIHVHVGINDIAGDRTWLAYIADISAICDLCKAHGAKMILDAIFPWTGNDAHTTGTYSHNVTRDVWNLRLRKWAQDNDVIFININNSLGQERTVPYDLNEPDLPSGNLWDLKPAYVASDTKGVHLNETGCAVAGHAVADQIIEYTTLAMDFDRDFSVDFHDMAIFSQSWLNIDYGEGALVLANAPTYQTTPTYDSSGQAIHPDIVYFPDEWNGYKYWMVMTPYPYYNSNAENPSILVSNDGSSWEIPPGLTNPIIDSPSPGYNADPDIVYNNDTEELWVYFFRYWMDTGLVKLTLMKSSDGVNWSEPEYLITWDRNIQDNERSYAVVKQGSDWHYWTQCFDAPSDIYYRHSTDGKNWSGAQSVTFLQVPSALPWHLDVIYVPTELEYWMLFNVYTAGELYLAKSTDRRNWTLYTNAVLSPSNYGWDNGQIYRPTLLYDSSSHLIRVWYSARNTESEWHTGYTETRY